MQSTAMTSVSPNNICLPMQYTPPANDQMCPIGAGMSQDFTALQRFGVSALESREQIDALNAVYETWLGNRIEQIQKNFDAFLEELNGLTDPTDGEALLEDHVAGKVMAHLALMTSDDEVGPALRRLIRAVNTRHPWESVEDVCDRCLGQPSLRDIKRSVALARKLREDRRMNESRTAMAMGLTAVTVLFRNQIAKALTKAAEALQTFRMAGTGHRRENAMMAALQNGRPPHDNN